jgi:hypothetical protein
MGSMHEESWKISKIWLFEILYGIIRIPLWIPHMKIGDNIDQSCSEVKMWEKQAKTKGHTFQDSA